jgi:hypothetical protein
MIVHTMPTVFASSGRTHFAIRCSSLLNSSRRGSLNSVPPIESVEGTVEKWIQWALCSADRTTIINLLTQQKTIPQRATAAV